MEIFAHRGHHTELRENTEAAFLSAARIGFQAVELDLRSTADGHVVILHDERAHRSLRSVSHITYAELLTIDPGILTFERFYELFQSTPLCVNFEIKDHPATYLSVRDRLRQFQNPVISSFEFAIADLACQDGFETGYLFASLKEFRENQNRMRNHRVHLPWREILTSDDLDFLETYTVYLYTINDRETYLRVLERIHLSGFFTDNPELLSLLND